MKEEYKNEDLLRLLRSTDPIDNDDALLFIYKVLQHKIQKFVKQNRGSDEDAADVFQEGLFTILKMSRQAKLHDGIQVQPYLYATCKYLWWEKLKQKDRSSTLRLEYPYQEYEQAKENWVTRLQSPEEEQSRLELILQRLSNDCYDILVQFYYKRLKMNEIATNMNLASEAVAKNKKSNCMKNLRSLIFSSSDHLGLR